MSRSLRQTLDRLDRITPMPDDLEVTEEQLEEYNQIVNELKGVQDLQIIRPLLRAFGYGTGYGLYWSAVHILESFDSQVLTGYLLESLHDESRGCRMWSVLMLGRLQDPHLMSVILTLVNDPEELVRSTALNALKVTSEKTVSPGLQG